jgi:hypothetical protein
MISLLCRDRILIRAAALLLCAASPAGAVVLFLDLGGTGTGVQGGPLDFSNPVVYAVPGEILTLHVWAVPDADDQKSVVALGHNIAAGGPAGGLISVVQYVLDNPAVGAGPRWDGVNLIGPFNGGGLLVSDARAVFVPLPRRPRAGSGRGTRRWIPAMTPRAARCTLRSWTSPWIRRRSPAASRSCGWRSGR